MGSVSKMSDRKTDKSGASKSAKGAAVVAHPKSKLRDIENLLRYVKRQDERRGID